MLSSLLFTDIIAQCIGLSKLPLHCQIEVYFWNVIRYRLQNTRQKNISSEHFTVFADLNQVSASLNLMCGRNRFLPAETQPCTETILERPSIDGISRQRPPYTAPIDRGGDDAWL